MDTSTLPTKNNLIRLQGKMALSKQGHDLLEKKKIILSLEKSKYENRKKELEDTLKELISKYYKKLIETRIDIGIEDLEKISNEVNIVNDLNIKYISVMGVEIPSVVQDEPKNDLQYSLYNTTVSLDEAMIIAKELKKVIISLAEVGNIIFRLDLAINKVSKRSSALENIIIPEDEKLIAQIKNILEEREREEFSRLKVVKKGKDEKYK